MSMANNHRDACETHMFSKVLGLTSQYLDENIHYVKILIIELE